MAKFDLKEHDEKMRQILNRQKAGGTLQPLPRDTLQRLVQVARQRRGR